MRLSVPDTGPAPEFAILPEAAAYLAALHGRLPMLGAADLFAALGDLERAYREFPELELQQPPDRLLAGVGEAVGALAATDLVVLFGGLAALADPSDEARRGGVLSFIRRSEPLRRDLLAALERLVREGCGASLGGATLVGIVEFFAGGDDATACRVAEILGPLLTGHVEGEPDAGDFAAVAASARRHIAGSVARQTDPSGRARLLALAERLRFAPPPPRPPRADLAWPSARLSFTEFLLQWPCEVRLSSDGDDRAFIAEAYTAILLRPPESAEAEQYLRLLRQREVSRRWVIEDLLGSEELALLRRRVRVVSDGAVLTVPDRPQDAAMPAVVWPPEPTSEQGKGRS